MFSRVFQRSIKKMAMRFLSHMYYSLLVYPFNLRVNGMFSVKLQLVLT